MTMLPVGTLIVIDLPAPSIDEPLSISNEPGFTVNTKPATDGLMCPPFNRCRFSPTVTFAAGVDVTDTLHVPAPSDPPNAVQPGSVAAAAGPAASETPTTVNSPDNK